ncbi:MAG TPA: metallopeptidase TldD-related protein [Terriglobales bacterium]|nr:metallopeptidase TldD-related protein [Terriglobales bacterium]
MSSGNGLADLAGRILQAARARGATAAECVLRESRELSATVRLGEIENLKEAGGRGLGIRVFIGHRAASTFTSDFSWPAVERMLDSASAIARVASEDPFAGLPDASELGQAEGDLGIYSPEVAAVTAEQAVEVARRCEAAALAVDPRLTNSEGGTFEAATSRKLFANSLDFVGEYRRSSCSLAAVPIAAADGEMQRDYWFSRAHAPADLDAPEEVGRIAAQRALRRLGARKIPTARVPVVFDAPVAGSLLDHIFQAVNGDSVYRGTSFLANRLGELVAHPAVTVVDDGLRWGGFGTTPFDGEGVRRRKTVVLRQGVLESYLLNSYTARKLGLRTTGNAVRGLAASPGVGVGNLFLEPGDQSPERILAGISQGLLVTEFIGMGVNLVTGDYSRGACGLWIENGELAYPVEEITVAGNLKDMLRNIAAIGNDLVFRGAVAAPTVLVEGLTVAGR